MKLILIQPLTGANGAKAKGDEIDVGEDEAIRYIKKSIAKPKNQKEYQAIVKKIEAQRVEEAEKEAQAAALLKEEQLKQAAREKAEELYDLLEKVALVDPNFSDEILEIFGIKSVVAEISGDGTGGKLEEIKTDDDNKEDKK